MKYVIVLPDGAADEPLEPLDGRTPLAAANTPNMDWIAVHGRQGRVVTVPNESPPGSDVATLSLLGYDPRTDNPGRAALEAAARGLDVSPGQVVFRCNLVTIVEGVMADFTAGHIRQKEADQLIAGLDELFRNEGFRFYAGVSYRNLMVAPPAFDGDPQTVPPHDIPDQAVQAHLPKGRGAETLRALMEKAGAWLREHEINLVRRDLGENEATGIWLWGPGRIRTLPAFAARFGVRGAVIAAVDLIRGIGRCIGFRVIDVPGATGYLDTDYTAKGRAGVAALDAFDLVVVHVEAPGEAGHLGDADAKITAIERIDEHVVGPLLQKLRGFPRWRILVAPDHPTPVRVRVRTRTPPPFCIAGYAIHPVLGRAFCEAAAAESDLFVDPGCDLMEYFLKL